MRYLFLLFLAMFMFGCTADIPTQEVEFTGDNLTPEEWEALLTPQEYHILWEAGTERAFTGDLLEEKREGVYVTKGCKLPIFHSEHKYKSGTGWPSFWEVYNESNLVLRKDYKLGYPRIEVLSACGEHLGHVFPDGPEPTGLRYCINSAALEFVPA